MSRAAEEPLEGEAQEAVADFEEIDKLTELAIGASDVKKYVFCLIAFQLFV